MSSPGFAHRLRYLLLLPPLLAGCSAPAPSAAVLDASYERALERSAPPVAADFPPGDPVEAAALARLETYFSAMTVTSVGELTAGLYAADGYLNDNLAFVEGAGAIEDYFLHAVGQVRSLKVEFLDVARTGPEYFVRWRMSIEAPRLNGGRPVVSYGVTHFRLDPQGRVLLHKDFWDAGTGLYEHLPGFGGLVRRLRGAVGGN